MSPELEQIRREAERLTRAMSRAEWHTAPPGKWSCGQIVEHLLLSYTLTTKGTQQALRAGKPQGGKPSVQDRIATFLVATLGYMPSGRVAFEAITPGKESGTESLRQFNDALVAMDASLLDAEKRFGSKVKLLDHPVLGPLNAQQWRRFHLTHGRHHLKQIARRSRPVGYADSMASSVTEKNPNTTAKPAGR